MGARVQRPPLPGGDASQAAPPLPVGQENGALRSPRMRCGASGASLALQRSPPGTQHPPRHPESWALAGGGAAGYGREKPFPARGQRLERPGGARRSCPPHAGTCGTDAEARRGARSGAAQGRISPQSAAPPPTPLRLALEAARALPGQRAGRSNGVPEGVMLRALHCCNPGSCADFQQLSDIYIFFLPPTWPDNPCVWNGIRPLQESVIFYNVVHPSIRHAT